MGAPPWGRALARAGGPGLKRWHWPQWCALTSPSAVFPAPRRLQPSTVLASLLAPLLLGWAALPVIARMGPNEARAVQAAPTGGPQVRVLLAQAPSWELDSQPVPLRLLDAQQRPLQILERGERLRLSAAAAGVLAELISADGSRRRLPVQAGGYWLEPRAEAAQPPVFAFGRERYRGRLQIRPGEPGRLLAINQLPLETYLPSVVGSEMPASWPQAALQAQAVAARTYALTHLKPGAAYDLKATVASQVYRGLAAETESTRKAVASTHNQVLMLHGKLIQAVFHSSGGGITEDSGQVWSRQLPYLVSVPDFDESSPVSRWTMRLEPEQLRNLFRETGGVRRIDVLASSGTGRIRMARVIGPAGSLELSGTELRQRLGLRSTLVSFAYQPVEPAARSGIIDSAVRSSRAQPPGAAVPPTRSAAGLPMGHSAAAASPVRPTQSPWQLAPAPVDSATGTIMEGPVAARPSFGRVDPGPTPGLGGANSTTEAEPAVALLVQGRGFGHGVGMSQWGAYAMALQGRNHEQILRHYYRGVELSSHPRP